MDWTLIGLILGSAFFLALGLLEASTADTERPR